MLTRSKPFAFLASTAVLAVTLALAATPDRPPRGYDFRTVDVPFGVPGEDLNMAILWMNTEGVITVQYQSPPAEDFLENMHTAVLRGCDWTSLDVPGAVTTGGTNASNNGRVALSHHSGDDIWHVSIRGRRGLTTFPDIPGYPGGITAQGINDRGHVAAVVGDADGNWHGFFGDDEDYAIFDAPGAVYTQANMINDRGVGVGYYNTGDGAFHAFMWDDGQLTNIDPPADQGTDAGAIGINNAGVIVGVWINPDGDTTGYVQDDDEFTEFAVPHSTFTVPYSINDRGQISGIYGDADGVAHGFVATPRHGRHRH